MIQEWRFYPRNIWIWLGIEEERASIGHTLECVRNWSAGWIITAGHENYRGCALHEEVSSVTVQPPPPSVAKYDNNPFTSYIICLCLEEELGHPSSGASPYSCSFTCWIRINLASGFVKSNEHNTFNFVPKDATTCLLHQIRKLTSLIFCLY